MGAMTYTIMTLRLTACSIKGLIATAYQQ